MQSTWLGIQVGGHAVPASPANANAKHSLPPLTPLLLQFASTMIIICNDWRNRRFDSLFLDILAYSMMQYMHSEL